MRQAPQKLQFIIPALFALLLFTNHVREGYIWLHTHQVKPTPDRIKVEAALNLYYLGLPWGQSTSGPQLADVVAHPSENVGGQEHPSRTYTVKSGDTLSGIADYYGLSSGTLVIANPGLSDADMLQIGQQLAIPKEEATDEQLAQIRKKSEVVYANTANTTGEKKQAAASGTYVTPLRYQYVSQGFSAYHPGIDLVAPVGTPIRAVADGCIAVMTGGWSGGYGNHIDLSLNNGYMARYAHMLTFAEGLRNNSCVEAGDLLGYVGMTGRTTGPHLHFELRRQGVPIAPPFK